jgi:hypothetical protein
MFDLFQLLYFTPFYFPNGKSAARNKYYIPICDFNGELIYAYLPTSKDFIPTKYEGAYGCINNSNINVSCFSFEKGKEITDSGFSFDRDTFIYLSSVNSLDKEILKSIYKTEGVDYEVIGKLKEDVIKQLIDCALISSSVSRKIKKFLSTYQV